MTGTDAACLHTNQSRSYLNHLVVAAELRTANVAYFQRKIQISVFSAYPGGSPSQLIRISGVLLYTYGGGGRERGHTWSFTITPL
jgi:hypothetical protein